MPDSRRARSESSGWYVEGGFVLTRAEIRRQRQARTSKRAALALLGVALACGVAFGALSFTSVLRPEEGPQTYVAAPEVVLPGLPAATGTPATSGGAPLDLVTDEETAASAGATSSEDPDPVPTSVQAARLPAVGLYQLSVPAAGIAAQVDAYSDAEVRANDGVTPPTLNRVSWWSGGNAPGAEGTTYFYGHTWYRPAVFNDLGEAAVGDRIEVTGPSGALTYEVTGSFVVDKDDLTSDTRVKQNEVGRLLLIACYREDGDEKRTTENLVLVAQQVG